MRSKSAVSAQLYEYFTNGTKECAIGAKVGVEIETHFVDSGTGRPITLEQSQNILKNLLELGWTIRKTKGSLISEVDDHATHTGPIPTICKYELGRQNIELSCSPMKPHLVYGHVINKLDSLYSAANRAKTESYHRPLLETQEDLLIIPDERDASWLALDGKEALNLLTKCASVQFTIDVSKEEAISVINRLNIARDRFLAWYPQDALWKQYIKESKARYLSSRYGGPNWFENLEDYCAELTRHNCIVNTSCVPVETVEKLDTDLFLRSVWWHFRLRRMTASLCIEIRPIARGTDEEISRWLYTVAEIAGFSAM